MRTLIQRLPIPVDPPIPLGAMVQDQDGDLWVVTGIMRPNDDWGGVLIELVSN